MFGTDVSSLIIYFSHLLFYFHTLTIDIFHTYCSIFTPIVLFSHLNNRRFSYLLFFFHTYCSFFTPIVLFHTYCSFSHLLFFFTPIVLFSHLLFCYYVYYFVKLTVVQIECLSFFRPTMNESQSRVSFQHFEYTRFTVNLGYSIC